MKSTINQKKNLFSFIGSTGASGKTRGKNVIELCKRAACHVNDSKKAIKLFEEALGIKMGQTTEEGLLTLQYRK